MLFYIHYSFVNLHGAIQLSFENLGVEKVSDKIFRLRFESVALFAVSTEIIKIEMTTKNKKENSCSFLLINITIIGMRLCGEKLLLSQTSLKIYA